MTFSRRDKCIATAAFRCMERLESRRLFSAVTLYVDSTAHGTNDGSTWANAFIDLQAALTLAKLEASAASPVTIDVASGYYAPSTVPFRQATFQLLNNVTLQGGFPRGGAPSPDVSRYQALLEDPSGKSSYVVTASGVGSSAIMNGLIVYGGQTAGLLVSNSSPQLENCDFEGGPDGVLNYGNPTFQSCQFLGNLHGLLNYQSSATIINCKFSNNGSPTQFTNGAAIYNLEASPTIISCTFTDNQAESYPAAIYDDENSSDQIYNCTFTANAGALEVRNSTAIVSGCTFNQNSSNLGAVGALSAVNLTLVDCSFIGNFDNDGGGAISAEFSSLSACNCLFENNHSGYDGGAIFNWQCPSASYVNCTFSGNYLADSTGAPVVGAAAISSARCSPVITNCICRDTLTPSGSEIDDDSSNSPIVTFSDVQGGYAGAGNIAADPQFVDASAGDLQLENTSPCINAGSNAAIEATGRTTDLAGNPRIVDGVVDMGAYEAQSIAVTFTGSGDGTNWTDPNNWSSGYISTANDDVTIPSGFKPVLGPGDLAIQSLNIQGTSTLDVGTGSLAIDYGAGNPSPLSTIQNYLSTGAIFSSVANANSRDAVGYADGSTDNGTAAQSGQVLVKYTLNGDTNLDGFVNFADLVAVIQNFNKAGTDWSRGNFTGGASTNFGDLVAIIQNFNKTLSPPAAGAATQLGGSTLLTTGGGSTLLATGGSTLLATGGSTLLATGSTVPLGQSAAAQVTAPQTFAVSPNQIAQPSPPAQPTAPADSFGDILQADVAPDSILSM